MRASLRSGYVSWGPAPNQVTRSRPGAASSTVPTRGRSSSVVGDLRELLDPDAATRQRRVASSRGAPRHPSRSPPRCAPRRRRRPTARCPRGAAPASRGPCCSHAAPMPPMRSLSVGARNRASVGATDSSGWTSRPCGIELDAAGAAAAAAGAVPGAAGAAVTGQPDLGPADLVTGGRPRLVRRRSRTRWSAMTRRSRPSAGMTPSGRRSSPVAPGAMAGSGSSPLAWTTARRAPATSGRAATTVSRNQRRFSRTRMPSSDALRAAERRPAPATRWRGPPTSPAWVAGRASSGHRRRSRRHWASRRSRRRTPSGSMPSGSCCSRPWSHHSQM